MTAVDAPPKASKMPLLIGLALAIAGAAGGFFVVQSGIVGGASGEHAEAATDAPPLDAKDLPFSFVALDPLVISLPGASGRNYLRFAAQMEVPPKYVAEVEAIKPRIVDVLNGYLRAVELAQLEDPTSLVRLRGQMLRRMQVVAGEGRIADLLIMEFVLN